LLDFVMQKSAACDPPLVAFDAAFVV